jgi:hypothetical protein
MIRKIAISTFMAVFGLVLFATADTTAYAQKTVSLPTEITRNMKLKKKKVYILEGGTFVRAGATLTIKPGTTIVGKTGSFLVIDKGARIIAEGTADKPIVFTSIQAPGDRARGDWGGIIFNGNAAVNCAAASGGSCEGEGGTGPYGGADLNDNQGSLRYVRVEFGGFPISPDNELNCVAFQGTGDGLSVDFVQAHMGGDDGFEWFGGSTNGKHLIATGAQDDSFDWTFGWDGYVQYGVIQQRADGPGIADRGIEADNNDLSLDAQPRSKPKLANLTIIGDPDATFPGSTQGLELRNGTAGELRNIVVQGFKREAVRISSDPTYLQYQAGALDIQGFIVFNNKGTANIDGRTMDTLNAKGLGFLKIQLQVNPQLGDPYNRTAPNFQPAAGSPALDAANAAPSFLEAFFDNAPYLGAFDGANNWAAGWTNFSSN